MYWALMYELVDDYTERRGVYREEHLGLARAAHERGELMLAGAFAEPADAALLVFTGPDASAATAFAENDPYVQSGIVTSWRVRPWTVVLGGA